MSQVRTHTIATLSRNSLARKSSALGTLTAMAAIIAIAPSANADFVIKRWTSDTNYELSMSHLPDFDQLRTGLGACGTGVAGANFCMPTSTANLAPSPWSLALNVNPSTMSSTISTEPT